MNRRMNQRMNRQSVLLPFLFTLLALHCIEIPVPLAAQSSERLEIIDRAIDHHGGEHFRDHETKLRLCSKSGCTEIQALQDGETFVHDVSGTWRGEPTRGRVTNTSIELWIDGTPQPITEEQALRDWVSSKVYFCFLPFRLNDPSVLKEDLGLESWGDRELHKVKVTFVDGSSTDADDEYVYWFDPKTAQLEQFAYSFHGSPGGLRFRQLHNYRRVGEILFFDQKNFGVANKAASPGAPEIIWSVEDITPQFITTQMRLVSDVELRDVEARP